LIVLLTFTIALSNFFYVLYARRQWKVMGGQLAEMARQYPKLEESADAAKSDAETAAAGLVLGQRPWVKIKHRIVSPLTFNIGGRASSIPVAMMTVEDTIENIGQSVAENVLSWEDVIPMDPDHSTKTARARQKEWCDANRHPDPRGLSGYTLFPHDPSIEQSSVGPQMPKVAEAVIRNEARDINGKVAFVLVGCVCYRSSFEKPDAPTHQTRFMYYLGVPQKEGGFQPYIFPQGVAADLRLITIPDGFTAD